MINIMTVTGVGVLLPDVRHADVVWLKHSTVVRSPSPIVKTIIIVLV